MFVFYVCMQSNRIMLALPMIRVVGVFLGGFLFCFVCTASEKLYESEEYCTINTTYGRIRGQQNRTTLDNKAFYSFRGIPYAKPPVGNLRFKVINYSNSQNQRI